MNQPSKEPTPQGIFGAIVGISALLCFALLLTSSIWLTIAIVSLGMLHLGPYFPIVEEFIGADPLLVGLRRFSILIIIGIFSLVWLGNMLR